jgi:hypothetical protein
LIKRYPGVDFEDDDIQKLVVARFETEAALATATPQLLTLVLPTRRGLVAILLKAFMKPAGMFLVKDLLC